MKTVKVKGVGIQVNRISHFKNDIFQVSDSEYEEIKDFVDVLKDDKKVDEEKRTIIIEVKDETIDLKEAETYLYECLEHFGEKTENVEDNADDKTQSEGQEDKELETLKEKAKELGIKVTSNMKKETIEKKIEEAENEKSKEGQDQNPEGE